MISFNTFPFALFLKKNCFVTCDTKTQWSASKCNFNKHQYSLLINMFYKYLIQQWIDFSHDTFFIFIFVSCTWFLLSIWIRFFLATFIQPYLWKLHKSIFEARKKVRIRFTRRRVTLSKHILQSKVKKHFVLLSELIIHREMEK